MEVKGLDLSQDLEVQGSFDVILHKLCGHFARSATDSGKAEELRRITEYFARHPRISFEPLDAIRDLNDRLVICRKLDGFDVRVGDERAGQPPYAAGLTVENVKQIRKMAPFPLPWIYKPIVADGIPESHDLAMVFSPKGLRDAKIPFIIQPFINHDGQILKIYVLGDTFLQIRRPSLPNREAGQAHNGPAFEPFGRISNAGKGKECNVAVNNEGDLVPEMSASLLREVVRELRSRLGTQLFGADFIRDSQTGHYLLIDVNYLPGYYGVDSVFEKLLDLMYQQRGR